MRGLGIVWNRGEGMADGATPITSWVIRKEAYGSVYFSVISSVYLEYCMLRCPYHVKSFL